MYRELPVAPELTELTGVVEAVWVRDLPGGVAAQTHRIVPDGCTDLIWANGSLLVAGPDVQAHLTTAAPGSAYAALRFAPGAGPTIFGVPGHELRDARIPLDALWPAGEVRRIADRVGSAGDRPRALQAVAAGLLRRTGAPDPVLAAITACQRAGASVADTAAATAWSERQLHRMCLTAFGYGPKVLARILRFRRAVAMARRGIPFAEVAARTGYADQAHLAREVRTLAGVPLGELAR